MNSENPNSQKSAFPEIILDSYSGKPCGQDHGISKRLYIATIAMQGILSGYYSNNEMNAKTETLVSEAYKFADELLKQENL